MIKVICSEPPTFIGSNTVISASSMARSNTRSCCGLARLHQTASSARKRREDAMRAELPGMTRFIWSTVMPDTARKTMADLARALDQSYRLYVRGRRIIAG
jgi:hypothetical protein